MAIDQELLLGLRAVQRVVGSAAFAELCAESDQEVRKSVREDTAGALKARGIELGPEIKRVEMKVRHTPPLARQRGCAAATSSGASLCKSESGRGA